MHMADALVSPAVGGAMLAAAAVGLGVSARKVRGEGDDRKVPLMGVLGAFIFAAQMVNFTIPGTGSSGHLGGGVILAALLGPWAAFLVMASVLTVQALFFADGGLLALGCNIVNLGALPAFAAYPLVFAPIAGSSPTSGRLAAASMASAVLGLQLGSFGVVSETALSGISDLPFPSFLLLMQPIHLAIGVVEGLATAAVIAFVWKARPELIERTASRRPLGPLAIRRVVTAFAALALAAGGLLALFASQDPDGLEWSVARLAGSGAPEAGGPAHEAAAAIQEKSALLPGYARREGEAGTGEKASTALSGLVGGVLVLLLALILGLLLNRRKAREPA